MKLLKTIRTEIAKRVAYARTLRELRTMGANVAADLGIDLKQADRIAHRAVYGA